MLTSMWLLSICVVYNSRMKKKKTSNIFFVCFQKSDLNVQCVFIPVTVSQFQIILRTSHNSSNYLEGSASLRCYRMWYIAALLESHFSLIFLNKRGPVVPPVPLLISLWGEHSFHDISIARMPIYLFISSLPSLWKP